MEPAKITQYPEQNGCIHPQSCMKEIVVSFLRNFRNGFILKLFLRIITERSFQKIRNHYSDIPNFGLVAGLFSAFFKITRCLLNKYLPSLDQRAKTFISGMVSSFAILFAS